VTDTLAAVIKEEPDWRLLPQDPHAKVRGVLQRCLQKEPKLRYHDIADARLDIEAPAIHPSESIIAPRRFSVLWLAVFTTIVLFAGILIGLMRMGYLQPAPSASVVTAIIKVEPGHWLEGLRGSLGLQHPSRRAMAISSDGKFIVYSAIEENPKTQLNSRLYLRWMDHSEAKPIAGTESGINPFLSPDNRWVGFWALSDLKLKKVPIEGGVPTPLCDASYLFGADWGGENNIVFSAGDTSGLSIVSADGGRVESLTTPDPNRQEVSHRLPSWLPDGKAVLFTVMKHPLDYHPVIALLRLDTREWHILFDDAADARYVPSGHIVFLKQGTLMAARFDLARLQSIGQPVPLVENVMQYFSSDPNFNTVAGQFGISGTGSLIYAAGGIVPDRENSLVWVDQKGVDQLVTQLQAPFIAPRLSPDGERVAYGTTGEKQQIWVYDLRRGTNTPLTSEGRAVRPVWTPDGKRLLFAWQKSSASNLFWRPYDASSPMERLTTSVYDQFPGSWSSDEHTIALAQHMPGGKFDITMLDVRSGQVTPFLNSQSNERYPEFSPDGRWIAYTSNESGRDEVYVLDYPGRSKKAQVSTEGGTEPLWARNGRHLFYRWVDQMWVVDDEMDGGFEAGKPRLLFEKPGYGLSMPIRGYDLSLDGRRFLMVKVEERKPSPATEMVLVQDWFEELKRLLPNK
jgi:serine/threonine-protein kinase